MGELNAINKIIIIITILLSFFSLLILYNNFKKITDYIKLIKENDKIKKNTYKILLSVIIIIGVIARLWKFGIIPGGFNQDGAMAAVDGLSLANYGTDRFGTWLPAHLYAWGYSQMSSLLSYLIAFFVKIFGFNEVVVRFPQLLASLMGGLFFYLFMKDIFGKKVGIIALFFVAINPWHFIQSRWALDCNLLPHFFMGGLYFLNKGLSKKKYNIYISMIFFALCMYCYGIAIYTIPVFLLMAAIYYYIKKRLSIKEILISILIYLLICWPFILTMAVNYFKWDTIKLPFVTIPYFSESVRANDIIFFSNNILLQLKYNIQSLLNTTLLQKKDLPWNDITNYGTMYLFTMPFILLGIIGFSKIKAKGNKALLVFALLTGLLAGIATNYVNVNRINLIYYGIMMFAVIGIYITISKIKYTEIIIPTIYAMAAIFFFTNYFTIYADQISHEFYYGFGDALRTAEKTGAKQIYITADTQGKGSTAVSEILTLFYDKTDARFYQGKTNINHGKEYLPYTDRFIYVSFNENIVKDSKKSDVAYVIKKDDKIYFNKEEYIFNDYGEYSSVARINK